MKIASLVKFSPAVDQVIYNKDNHTLKREQSKLVINPQDATALAFALQQKQLNPKINIEVVSMSPPNVLDLVRDLLRRKVDHATLLSDRDFAGSDTFATSKILTKYLKTKKFDLIVTGSYSLDGDTAHVPAQVATLLKYSYLSGIKMVKLMDWKQKRMIVELEGGKSVYELQVALPAVIGFHQESSYRLPYVSYQDLDLEVDDRIAWFNREELMLGLDNVGLNGSLTKVVHAHIPKLEHKQHIIVQNDLQGIETVYQFLKQKDFV